MPQKPFSFQIGSFNCIACSDGEVSRPAENIFPTVPATSLATALAEFQTQPASFQLGLNFLYVDTGTCKVLIDTGRGGAEGELLNNLKKAKIAPESIELLILTHGHGDHIGACTDEAGKPVFPHARHVMRKQEWDFWHDPMNTLPNREFVAGKIAPLKDRIELIEHETEIIPGFIAVSAPGHSPGHMVLFIRSGGDKFLHAADLMHHPIQIRHTDWATRFDMNPEQAADNRRRLTDWGIEQGCTFFFTHYPFPGLGKIKEIEGVRKWVPTG